MCCPVAHGPPRLKLFRAGKLSAPNAQDVEIEATVETVVAIAAVVEAAVAVAAEDVAAVDEAAPVAADAGAVEQEVRHNVDAKES